VGGGLLNDLGDGVWLLVPNINAHHRAGRAKQHLHTAVMCHDDVLKILDVQFLFHVFNQVRDCGLRLEIEKCADITKLQVSINEQGFNPLFHQTRGEADGNAGAA
jgi:hypothetical protein